jgi:DNA-binding FadR family transcriptional regulator
MEFFRDLFEVRRVVEPAAAALAAEKATMEDLQAIETACTDMERADPSSDAAILADMAFHRAILTACHNVLLLQMGTLIAVGLHTSFRISTRFYPASLPHHRPVANAILARESAAAHAAMQTLLKETFHVVERQLSPPLPGQS